MRFTTSAVFLIIFISVISIFVANFANILSVDKELLNRVNDNGESSRPGLRLSDKLDHLMWFVQVSDIHISTFSDPERIEQFKKFVAEDIDIINPKVVVASGDITDARDSDILGSRQFIEEWRIYADTLRSSNITEKTIWLDIRGNHDFFNVPDIDSPLNYFRTHSIQGKIHSRSYLKQVKVGSDTYSFIAVDACPDPGLKRQLNFFGILDFNETNRLIDLHKEAQRNGGNYTVWFGHYPTSCILSTGSGTGGIRDVIGSFNDSYVYLCGHLHTQGGLISRMYTLQKSGFLELELGDWRTNRLFRIAAFDHGLFSFVDTRYNKWPVVLVTNPKDALFNLPDKEKPDLQLTSTHIRILIFSPSKITYCAVQVRGYDHYWRTCDQVSKNLFVVPWNPDNYKNGILYLDVHVRAKDNSFSNISHPFSLDGSRMSFNLWGRFILMSDLNKIFQAMFGFALCLCVVPLFVLRIHHELVVAGKLNKPRIRWQPFRNFVRKLWILSTIDRMIVPLLVFFVYIAAGPWSVGEIIDGHTGVVFVWGVFVNNAFIPGNLTYVYGFFQLILCQFPLILIYANVVNSRYITFARINNGKERRFELWTFLPFGLIILMEIILAAFFCWLHGFVAFILTPIRTWSILFNIVMGFVAFKAPQESLRSAMSVWLHDTRT